MADRYLLESGSPDGYLLEDGTGVLLLNNSVAWEWDNSSQFFTLSSDGLTATATIAGDHLVRAGVTLAAGSFTVTPTFSGFASVGFSDLAQISSDWIGDSPNSIGYNSNGTIYDNNATVLVVGASYVSGDVIKAEIQGDGKFYFYKNGTLQNPGGSTGPVGLTSPYPAASTSAVGNVLVADFTGWATGVTHATTGVLTGPGSTIAGTAAHIAIHTSTGALIGAGSTIAASAARTAIHATTGVLIGPGSTIAGVAVYNAKHTTTGILIGPGSTIIGSATRFRAHATSGALTGAGSVIIGVAVYNAKHSTTGALTGPGSAITGTAARFRAHATSGVIVGPGSTIVGAALRGIISVTHATSGALIGQPSILTGTAARTRAHATSGILTGPPSLVTGYAARWRDHGSSGVLLGVTSVVFGRVFNGTPELQDIPVDSDNLVNETSPPSEDLGPITEPSGQIVNHPPYPAA